MKEDNNKTFSKLSDDVVLKILFLLEDDPRNWARLSCVSRKLSDLISDVCCKTKCLATLSPDLHACAWSLLYKMAVCCPGLRHSGILLDHSDFGLLRQLGPHTHPDPDPATPTTTAPSNISSSEVGEINETEGVDKCEEEEETWTMYDDLYNDTIYDNSEASGLGVEAEGESGSRSRSEGEDDKEEEGEGEGGEASKKRKLGWVVGGAHLATGKWKLSREEGKKLLGSRFREDCLYLSDWPGCVHVEEKRKYMVFRGVFKNFKRSRVWRTINDGQRSKVEELNCAFCGCDHTWDLHSSFCLKRGFGFHDDGDPVVRAYVCENGHVSGAWTDFPFYS